MRGAAGVVMYRALRRALVEARERAGLSQAEVARRLGRPQSFVSKYETGERRLDVVELIDVARSLGAKPEQFVATVSRVHGRRRPALTSGPRRRS